MAGAGEPHTVIATAKGMFAAPPGSRSPSGALARYRSPKDAKLGLSIDYMIKRGDDAAFVAAFAEQAMATSSAMVEARRMLRTAADAALAGDLDRAADLWNRLDAESQYHNEKFVERANDHGLLPPAPASPVELHHARQPSTEVLKAMRRRDGNKCRYDGEPITSKDEVIALLHLVGVERLERGVEIDVGDKYPLHTQVYPGITKSGTRTISLSPDGYEPVPNANASMAKYYSLTDVKIGDHVIPHAMGGRSDLSNLIVCCNPCNYAKSNWSLDDLRTPRVDANDPASPRLGTG
jgi:hypothetical protein